MRTTRKLKLTGLKNLKVGYFSTFTLSIPHHKPAPFATQTSNSMTIDSINIQTSCFFHRSLPMNLRTRIESKA